MSGRPKIKSKVVKATLGNKDVLDMFHGVLGTSDGAMSLPITHPKYQSIQNHVDRFLRLLEVLRDSKLMLFFPGPADHLAAYVGALRGQFASSFNAPDLAPYLKDPEAQAKGLDGMLASAEDYARVPPEVVTQFGTVFAEVKKCNLVNTIVVTCKNLVTHKRSIQDEKALKDRFLLKGAAMSFSPLPDLPQLNLKQVYIDDRLTPENKEFVLVVIHKLYTISHDVYEAVSSPDVDVGEFVEVIMSSIGEVRKHIPRCDQAFNKIVESVDLLKGNFGGYYKDYVASNNPTIIMENFVLDVSKSTKSSPTVTAQFRKIIMHYRKLASQQATHPKLQSLFQQVDKNFQELESKSKDADKEGGDSDSEDDSGGDADAPADPGAPVPTPPAKDSAPAPAPLGPHITAALDGPKDADGLPAPAPAPKKPSKNSRRRKARAQAKEAVREPASEGEGLADEFDRAEDAMPPLEKGTDADGHSGPEND